MTNGITTSSSGTGVWWSETKLRRQVNRRKVTIYIPTLCYYDVVEISDIATWFKMSH